MGSTRCRRGVERGGDGSGRRACAGANDHAPGGAISKWCRPTVWRGSRRRTRRCRRTSTGCRIRCDSRSRCSSSGWTGGGSCAFTAHSSSTRTRSDRWYRGLRGRTRWCGMTERACRSPDDGFAPYVRFLAGRAAEGHAGIRRRNETRAAPAGAALVGTSRCVATSAITNSGRPR